MSRGIQFTKIRNVKTPNRGTSLSAGIDFYIPYYDDKFFEDLKAKNVNNKLLYQMFIDDDGSQQMEITIPTGEQVNIPSGIKVIFLNKSSYLDAENKSGIASKYHLLVGAKVIDADYRGEIHINLCNVGNTTVTIKTGMKVAQFIHKEYLNEPLMELTNDMYDELTNSAPTERGDGGFSSTGLN